MKKNGLIKVLPLVAVALVGVAIATSCKKDKDEMTVSNIHYSKCLLHDDTQQKGFKNLDSISLCYNNGTLLITHYNLMVNCAFERINVSFVAQNNIITIYERDLCTTYADCECEINNSFEINNIKQGTYTFVFDNWYNGPYSQTFTF